MLSRILSTLLSTLFWATGEPSPPPGPLSLPKNLTFHPATPVGSSATPRPLVLLFPWLLAKEVHISKFTQFWTARGFDVLAVRTAPLDAILPFGNQPTPDAIVAFLSDAQRPKYSQILVHALSVGGFTTMQLFVRLVKGPKGGLGPSDEETKIYKSIKGIVADSLVWGNDAEKGMSRAITLSPFWQPILEKFLGFYLWAGKSYTVDRYWGLYQHFQAYANHIPVVLFFSKNDPYVTVEDNYRLVEKWQSTGTTLRLQVYDQCGHVMHYKEHPGEYEHAIEAFIAKDTEIEL